MKNKKMNNNRYAELDTAFKYSRCFIPKYLVSKYIARGKNIDEVFKAAKNAYSMCGHMGKDAIYQAFEDELN